MKVEKRELLCRQLAGWKAVVLTSGGVVERLIDRDGEDAEGACGRRDGNVGTSSPAKQLVPLGEGRSAADHRGCGADFVGDVFRREIDAVLLEYVHDRRGGPAVDGAGREQDGLGGLTSLDGNETPSFHNGADKAPDALLDRVRTDPIAKPAEELCINRLDGRAAALGRIDHGVLREEVGNLVFKLSVGRHQSGNEVLRWAGPCPNNCSGVNRGVG